MVIYMRGGGDLHEDKTCSGNFEGPAGGGGVPILMEASSLSISGSGCRGPRRSGGARAAIERR